MSVIRTEPLSEDRTRFSPHVLKVVTQHSEILLKKATSWQMTLPELLLSQVQTGQTGEWVGIHVSHTGICVLQALKQLGTA